MSLIARPQRAIEYPESDGEPMAENTLQFDWIVRIKEGLDDLFRDDPSVFIAGDLLWYPVECDPATRMAPDAMVAFGRPKGHRASYLQWEEGGVAPQVVFEVLSPGNRAGELARKLRFYERHGVEEYYQYDPDRVKFRGWLREDDRLVAMANPEGWTSPRLQVRFDMTGPTLVIYRPDGRPLLNYAELSLQRDSLAERNARLLARLRELGVEPAD